MPIDDTYTNNATKIYCDFYSGKDIFFLYLLKIWLVRTSYNRLDESNEYTQSMVLANKNTKMSSFKSSVDKQKKERGPDRPVSNNKFSSVTLDELAMKARQAYCNFEFQHNSQYQD